MGDATEKRMSSQEIKDLIQLYQQSDDSQALETLVQEFLPLVKYLARRFVRDAVSYDDLVQVGSIGLLKSFKRYDVNNKAKFITFVTPTIIGEIKHYFRDRQWSVHVPRRIKELGNKIYKAMPVLTQQLQRTPNPKDMAAYLQVSEEEVLESLEWGQAYQSASLDSVLKTAEDNSDLTLISALGKEDLNLRQVEEKSELLDLFKVLNEDEKKVIHLRFEKELTQREIGKIMDMSQMQVSRLLKKIVGKLHQRRLELYN